MIDIHGIKKSLDSTPDDWAIEKMWREIQHGPPSPAKPTPRIPKQYRPLAAVLAVAALLSITVAVSTFFSAPLEPLTIQNTTTLPGTINALHPQFLSLSDGTRLQIQKNTTIEFVKNTHADVEIAVRRGSVHFDIPPKGPRKWLINCGVVQIDVVGTVFDIEKSESVVRVSVHRGVVLLRGDTVPEGVQRLEAGEQLSVQQASQSPDTLSRVANSPLEPQTSHKEADALYQAANDDIQSERDTTSSFLTKIAMTDIPTIDELFLLADTARLNDTPEDGIGHLHLILTHYPTSPRTPLAAFTIAKMYFNALHTPTRAAEYYEKSISLGLNEPLRENALAKTAEAYRAARNPKYKEAAQTYLDHYTRGQYSERMQHLLQERQ